MTWCLADLCPIFRVKNISVILGELFFNKKSFYMYDVCIYIYQYIHDYICV